jgi:tripartite-type tricarboxylate transporter receptor subunit TctC
MKLRVTWLHWLIGVVALALAVLVGTDARAQTWPSRPVHIIVAFAPGGTIDALARILAQKLSERWGQSVIVDNRGGAAGNLGALAAAQAPADGTTLHLGAQSLATNVTIAPVPGFDPVAAFAPIILVATAQDVLMVPLASGDRTLAELIADAKAHPGALNYASLGTGSSGHLATVLFAREAGIKVEHVPIRPSRKASPTS